MLLYRSVITNDLPIICSFAQSAEELYFFYPKARYPLTTEQLSLAIAQRSHSTVVEKNNQIAGFANFYQWQHNGCCKIGNVIINPKLRQQGVASYLVKVMLEQAKQSFNAKEVQVSCFNSNTGALLLYNKLGFMAFAIEERLYQQQKLALIHLKYPITY